MINGKELVLSLTSTPKRLKNGYLKGVLEYLPKYERLDRVDKFYLCLDDNLKDGDRKAYEDLVREIGEKSGIRFSILAGSAEWRSCNKLLPVYLENPDRYILTIDDDARYPKGCFRQLFEVAEKEPDCIVCQEANPLVRTEKGCVFLNSIDVMLRQKCWASYLSNACLFPPNCFDEKYLTDLDDFKFIWNSSHDEKHFMVASIMKGTQVVSLPYTYSYELDANDEGNPVKYPEGPEALSVINRGADVIGRMNDRLCAKYGDALLAKTLEKPVIFELTPEQVQLFVWAMPYVKRLYQGFDVVVDVSRLTGSWRKVLAHTAAKLGFGMRFAETENGK